MTARSVSGSVPTSFAIRLAAVGQRDLDLVGRFDHVVVGQDVAFRADDDAGTQAGLLFFLLALAFAEEAAEQRVFHQRIVATSSRPCW